MSPAIRPAEVCKALLAALDASEGQRKRRKRDQTPDAIGLAVKRGLLERNLDLEHASYFLSRITITPTDQPDIGYAMIFPGMTIAKIIFVDIVPAFFR